jgi:hypothetical protein
MREARLCEGPTMREARLCEGGGFRGFIGGPRGRHSEAERGFGPRGNHVKCGELGCAEVAQA